MGMTKPRTVTRAFSASILIGWMLWLGTAAQQQPPPCADNPDLDRAWSAAWSSLGLQPSPPRMPLGDVAAKRWFGEGNWYPVDGANQTMCGTLRDWSVYDGRAVTPHELDVHPYISPSSDFRFLIEDLPDVARGNTFVCRLGNGTGVPCLWGEVTTVAPIGRKLLGPRFPKVTANDKPYLGNAACMFGPWVSLDRQSLESVGAAMTCAPVTRARPRLSRVKQVRARGVEYQRRKEGNSFRGLTKCSLCGHWVSRPANLLACSLLARRSL
jgi:hypothetical protein